MTDQVNSALEKLRSIAEKEKTRRRRQQIPKNRAPNVSCDEHIMIGGISFKKIKQEGKLLTLCAVEHDPKGNPLNAEQVCSYAVSVNRVVSAGGWDWRTVRAKKGGKLLLKPIAPTENATRCESLEPAFKLKA